MPMPLPFTIRSLTADDSQAILDLETAYARVYPGAVAVPPVIYGSPGFHGGLDVFCAFDPSGRLLAYAPVFLQPVSDGPASLPHAAWTEIKAQPDLPDPYPVKDALYECVIARVRALLAEASLPARPVRLTFEYKPNEEAAVAYVQARGLAYTESVFYMARDLNEPLPESRAPEGIAIRLWKMPGVDEQRAYVAAHNACFPEAPITLEAWQYFMQSPQWAAGTAVAAFDGSQVVGALSAFWSDDEIRDADRPFGYTEDIFVSADWRGRGVASAMIAEGMRFLKAHGIQEARLSVRALNENALALYRRLGYRVGQESRFYAKLL